MQCYTGVAGKLRFMNKKDRQIIFEKCNGRCAYCGCQLTKGWHVSKILSEAPIVNESGDLITPNDTLENKLPSCAACNMSRTRDNGGVTFINIEEFRQQLYENLRFIQSFPYYQRALRFGMITETNIEVKFYFETVGSNAV